MYQHIIKYNLSITFLLFFCVSTAFAQDNLDMDYILNNNDFVLVDEETWETPPTGGDTIFITIERTRALKIRGLSGTPEHPLVVINSGGQVNIDSESAWGAITFESCRYIKISGNGAADTMYGFKLAAKSCGLAFSELSSDCEAEFIHIDHDGFFGIYAKKDYGGFPPIPAPVFDNLSIHDCLIENVTEGMYLGETKSPGMEFTNVKIYNNIVLNTGREAIQIANMLENIEVYNNTLINAGLNGTDFHGNILQIGDNSVAKVYNNILIGGSAYGVICFGKGQIEIENNYISDCQGIFLDNRIFTDTVSSIEIRSNYFSNINGENIIKNMNELNSFLIIDNSYNTDIDFYNNSSHNDFNFILENNSFEKVKDLNFIDADNNNYLLARNNSSKFKDLGAYPILNTNQTVVEKKVQKQKNIHISTSQKLIATEDLDTESTLFLTVHPNPTIDKITLNSQNIENSILDFKILSSSGKLCYQSNKYFQENTDITVSLSSINLPKGVYFINATDVNGISNITRVIKLN